MALSICAVLLGKMVALPISAMCLMVVVNHTIGHRGLRIINRLHGLVSRNRLVRRGGRGKQQRSHQNDCKDSMPSV